MRSSLAWLAHHVLVHPIVGVMHFAGDLALWCGAPSLATWLWRVGDRLHAWPAPSCLAP